MGGQLPFDRHDWYVDRCGQEVRYVIDFYFHEEKAGTPEVGWAHVSCFYCPCVAYSQPRKYCHLSFECPLGDWQAQTYFKGELPFDLILHHARRRCIQVNVQTSNLRLERPILMANFAHFLAKQSSRTGHITSPLCRRSRSGQGLQWTQQRQCWTG